MSKPAGRKGDYSSGHGPFVPQPSNSGSGNVITNSKPAMNTDSTFPEHCVGKSCHPSKMVSGSGTVMINGKPASRIGDNIDCGETLILGSGNVLIGD